MFCEFVFQIQTLAIMNNTPRSWLIVTSVPVLKKKLSKVITTEGLT